MACNRGAGFNSVVPQSQEGVRPVRVESFLNSNSRIEKLLKRGSESFNKSFDMNQQGRGPNSSIWDHPDNSRASSLTPLG